MILLKKNFLLDGKKLSLAGVCEKCKNNVFHNPENQLSTNKNNLFLSKLFFANSNNGFHYQQNSSYQKKILFLLGGKSVSISWMKDIEK